MIIGLTGGIASGKSTVSKMLVRRGAALVDADKIAREIVLPGSPVLSQVVDRFGQAILQSDGSLNRKKLGEVIFSDVKARKDLEAILHPPIKEMEEEQIRQLEEENPHRLIVVDIPLLFEANAQNRFPEVMVVYVPEAIQIKRLMERDQLTEEQAIARLSSQMPIEDKKKLADIVIDNSGTLQQTEQQIDIFWKSKGL